MGQFSWLDCVTQEQIIDNRHKDVYLLVPEQFADQYGPRIVDDCYDGYGHFDRKDVFDLVALWNQDSADESLIEYPDRAMYMEEKYFNMAIERYQRACKRLKDFQMHQSEDYMVSVYGKDYLREIGNEIGCDKNNAKLRFPIKITYSPTAVYEECSPSLRDPDQGWPRETEEDEEWERLESDESSHEDDEYDEDDKT